MGEASSAQDQLLVVLPFPEPEELIEGLRRDFPALKVLYFCLNERGGKEKIWKESAVIPKGEDMISAD